MSQELNNDNEQKKENYIVGVQLENCGACMSVLLHEHIQDICDAKGHYFFEKYNVLSDFNSCVELFTELKNAARVFLGNEISGVVVIIPDDRNFKSMAYIRCAAEKCNLTVKFVQKATAIAVYITYSIIRHEKQVIFLQLMKGTWDMEVSLHDVGEGVIEALATRYIENISTDGIFSCISEAGLSADKIDMVYIDTDLAVEAEQLVVDIFGESKVTKLKMGAVNGAAIIAAKIDGSCKTESYLLTLDIISVGIGIKKQDGEDILFCKRNMTIPTKKSVPDFSLNDFTGNRVCVYLENCFGKKEFIELIDIFSITESAGSDEKIEVTIDIDAKFDIRITFSNRYETRTISLLHYILEMQNRVRMVAKVDDSNKLVKFLDVLDNFDRSIQFAEKNADLEFLKGLKMIKQQMLHILSEEGISPIDAVGKSFSTDYHEAVSHVVDSSYGENVVIEEFQTGYMYKGAVMRYSKVKVAN